MPLISSRWLAAASLALAALAPARPRYGETLRVQMSAVIQTPDPAEWPADPVEAAAKARLISMVFEPLVKLDDSGRPQPALAISWRQDNGGRRWQFRLRPGVKFHDGTPLTAAVAAAALGARGYSTVGTGETISIQSEKPLPDLPRELAQPRNAIVNRTPEGALAGTGPFRLADWTRARRAALAAFEDYWSGRAYLDAVEIAMNRPPREQMLDIELGRADLVEIPIAEHRRAQQRNLRLWTSNPSELMAILFERNRPTVQDARLREILGLAVDRGAMHAALLQRLGEPTGALLPQWISGHAFLFAPARDLARARQLLPTGQTPLQLACEATDPLARLIADRIALNAREAGLTVRVVTTAAEPDLRLVRLPVTSANAVEALEALGQAHELSGEPTPESLYRTERRLLAEQWIVPLFHVPVIFGLSPRLRNWMPSRSGAWKLEDVWLSLAEKP